jgi:hypothetical protein
MRFHLRVLCGTSLLAVALFSATAYADVIPYSLTEAGSIFAAVTQTAIGPITSYADTPVHNQANSYVEAEDFLVPFDEDYQYDAVAYSKAVATQNPKPGNFFLLGSGLLTVAGLVRRRKSV